MQRGREWMAPFDDAVDRNAFCVRVGGPPVDRWGVARSAPMREPSEILRAGDAAHATDRRGGSILD